MSRATATKVAVFPNFFEKSNGYFSKKYPLKFSKLKNQGPLFLNEAMPDLMVVFLGWNSSFEKKKCVGPTTTSTTTTTYYY